MNSVRKTVTARLGLWLNPRIDAATSTNDFDLRSLRQRPMSIYLGVTPDNLDRMAPLLNLFFQQVVDLNTRELPEQNPKLNRKVLLCSMNFPPWAMSMCWRNRSPSSPVTASACSPWFRARRSCARSTDRRGPQLHDQPRRRGGVCAEGTGRGE